MIYVPAYTCRISAATLVQQLMLMLHKLQRVQKQPHALLTCSNAALGLLAPALLALDQRRASESPGAAACPSESVAGQAVAALREVSIKSWNQG